MTQLQKVAWLNLVFFPLLVVVIVLGELGVLSHTAQLVLVCLLLAAVIVALVLMAKAPWHKGTVEDERDNRFRRHSFAAAYFVLMGCLPIGLVVSIIAFPGEEIPLRFVAAWLGVAGMASVFAQSVALLVQYGKGIRDNS